MAPVRRGFRNTVRIRRAGLACLESQNYAQAVTAFDDAIALTHGRIGTFEIQMMLYRAEAQYRSGDYQSALAAYETLLREG